MKIAICLSGQPRAWKAASSSFSELINSITLNHPGCVIDTFIHMWDFNTKSNIEIDHTDTRHPVEIYRANSSLIIDTEIQEILSFYKPKRHLIENIDKSMEIVYNAMFGDQPASAGWSSSQFYSMQRAAFLKRDYEIERGEDYNWCIRYRFDLDMKNSGFNIPTLSNFNNWTEKPSVSDVFSSRKYIQPTNTLYSVHSRWDKNYWPYYRIGDIFFIADSITYDLVCNFYDWMLWIPNDLFSDNPPPEIVFSYYLNMLRININQLQIDPSISRNY